MLIFIPGHEQTLKALNTADAPPWVLLSLTLILAGLSLQTDKWRGFTFGLR